MLACYIVVAGVRKNALVFYKCRHRIRWSSCFGDFSKANAKTSWLFPHSTLPNFCLIFIWQQICVAIKIEHASRPIARHKLKRATYIYIYISSHLYIALCIQLWKSKGKCAPRRHKSRHADFNESMSEMNDIKCECLKFRVSKSEHRHKTDN